MDKLESLRRYHFSQETPKKYDIPIELKERCKKLHVLLDWKQCPTKTNGIKECRFVWKQKEALIIECEKRENKKKCIYYYKEEPDLETIQKIVNGYFTIIMMDDNKKMYVNEEGKLRKLKLNKEASNLVGFKVYGNVLVVE